jgi:hypothetical protein
MQEPLIEAKREFSALANGIRGRLENDPLAPLPFMPEISIPWEIDSRNATLRRFMAQAGVHSVSRFGQIEVFGGRQ